MIGFFDAPPFGFDHDIIGGSAEPTRIGVIQTTGFFPLRKAPLLSLGRAVLSF